jgi:Cu/Zn superoxide dismutase
MLSSTFVIVLSAAALVGAQTPSTVAPVVNNNPIGASFFATLPNTEGSTLRGTITGSTSGNGTGVDWAISLSGLPTAGGPFLYHIHEKPIPANGNCTAAGAHQDPYKRGEDPPCDPTQKANCQTGDLSGKYGKINGTAFAAAYHDLYTSTNPKDPAYFGNLSIVVHLANKTRIGCANFVTIATGFEPPAPPVSVAPPHSNATASPAPSSPGSTHDGQTPSGTGSPAVPPQPSAPQSTGAASALSASMTGAVLVAGLMAAFF